jgi:hypothetical protein
LFTDVDLADHAEASGSRMGANELPFYAAHRFAELLIIDPDQRTVRWLALGAGASYDDVAGSALIDLTAAALHDAIDWPS